MTTSKTASAKTVDVAPAEAHESKRLSDDAFRSLCQDILSAQGKKRRMLCRAFKASFNDLYSSKSLDRLNIFLKTIELLPEKGKLLAACRIYLGGVEISKDGDLIRRDERCCAVLAQHIVRVPGKSEPGKKVIAKDEKQFILCDDENLFASAANIWRHVLFSIDYDCLSVKTSRKEVTASDVQKFFARLEKSRQFFREEDSAFLENLVTWAKTNKIIA
jgi:hypothetical protein